MKKTFAKKEEVILLLKSGWEILTNRKKATSNAGRTLYNSLTYYISKGSDSKWVHHSTIHALQQAQIIDKKYQLK